MKKYISRSLSIGLIISIGLLVGGCSNIAKTPTPQVYHDKTKPVGLIRIGVDKNIEVNASDTYFVEISKPVELDFTELHNYKKDQTLILNKWGPDEYNTIYRDKDDCFTDINNSGFFTHGKDEDDMNDLGKLHSSIEYKIIPTRSTYSNIPKPKIYHDTTKTIGKSIIRTPILNQTKTVEIGENIYQKINQYQYDTYEVILTNPDNLYEMDKSAIEIGKSIYQKIKRYQYDTYGLILSSPDSLYKMDNRAIKDTMKIKLYKWTASNYNAICTDNQTLCWVDINKSNFFTHNILVNGKEESIDELKNPIMYKIVPTPATYDEDSFKYQALYQGRIGNKIKISFREFSADMMRPAFTQDIEYELDKNGEAIIGFKGLRVKVKKATNMDITYSVIQDYN